jgi:16S rRNA (cytidine1402-2'-O)-methyltransferase
MSGTLYLVATPIGNLEDITIRALNILSEVDLIACEDTRRTIKLLNHFDIKTPLISYHQHNENSRSSELLEKISSGNNVALVSDAGTPSISDPGLIIVKDAIAKGINVTSIPGPTAMIAALIVSGLDTNAFSFFGFLPEKNKDRNEKLEYIKNLTETLIFYVSPHSYKKDMNEFNKYLGSERNVVIAREITKIHETIVRGKLGDKDILEYNPRGEICIVIEGAECFIQSTENPLCELSVEKHLGFYLDQGLKRNNAMREVGNDRGLSKNEVYELILKEKKG